MSNVETEMPEPEPTGLTVQFKDKNGVVQTKSFDDVTPELNEIWEFTAHAVQDAGISQLLLPLFLESEGGSLTSIYGDGAQTLIEKLTEVFADPEIYSRIASRIEKIVKDALN